MTTPETIAFLRDARAHAQYQVDGFDAAIAILEDGYQSDQEANAEAVRSGVASGLADVVKEATEQLRTRINTAASALSAEDTDPAAMVQNALVVLTDGVG